MTPPKVNAAWMDFLEDEKRLTDFVTNELKLKLTRGQITELQELLYGYVSAICYYRETQKL
jgi:hypothetical protein